MNRLFFVAAAVMIAAALVLLLLPLLRHGRRSKATWATLLLTCLLLPGLAISLYARVGTPAAFESRYVASSTSRPMQPAIDETLNSSYQRRLQAIQAWMRKAQAFDAAAQPAKARDAYRQIMQMAPENTAAMVGWVEADMTQHAGYTVSASSRQLLEQAIALEPDNQRVLWLLGISDFQQGRYAHAAATWRHLQHLLGQGSALAPAVQQQISIADAKAKTMPKEAAR